MTRKSIAFLLVAFALVAGFASRSQAQTYVSARQTGAIAPDNTNGISVYVYASLYNDPDPTFSSPPSGTIIINGISGYLSVSIGANVNTLVPSTWTYNGKKYKQASVQTSPFYFVDPVLRTKTLAYAKVNIIQYGYGLINFQVISLDSHSLGATLSATVDPNTGKWANLPIINGYTTIFSY